MFGDSLDIPVTPSGRHDVRGLSDRFLDRHHVIQLAATYSRRHERNVTEHERCKSLSSLSWRSSRKSCARSAHPKEQRDVARTAAQARRAICSPMAQQVRPSWLQSVPSLTFAVMNLEVIPASFSRQGRARFFVGVARLGYFLFHSRPYHLEAVSAPAVTSMLKVSESKPASIHSF